MKNKRKEWIRQIHSEVCTDYQSRIEQEFPKLFKSKYEVGDWIVGNDSIGKKSIEDLQLGRILNISKEEYKVEGGYIYSNKLMKVMNWGLSVRKAANEEIKEYLIKEAGIIYKAGTDNQRISRGYT